MYPTLSPTPDEIPHPDRQPRGRARRCRPGTRSARAGNPHRALRSGGATRAHPPPEIVPGTPEAPASRRLRAECPPARAAPVSTAAATPAMPLPAPRVVGRRAAARIPGTEGPDPIADSPAPRAAPRPSGVPFPASREEALDGAFELRHSFPVFAQLAADVVEPLGISPVRLSKRRFVSVLEVVDSRSEAVDSGRHGGIGSAGASAPSLGRPSSPVHLTSRRIASAPAARRTAFRRHTPGAPARLRLRCGRGAVPARGTSLSVADPGVNRRERRRDLQKAVGDRYILRCLREAASIKALTITARGPDSLSRAIGEAFDERHSTILDVLRKRDRR